MTNKDKKLIDWFLGDGVGLSSKAIVAFFLDLDYEILFDYPRDKGDRKRCIDLLKIRKDWFEKIDKMKNLNMMWFEEIELIKKEFNNYDQERENF